MKIQVNTDNNIEATDALVAMVEAELRSALEYFEDRLTRVEVHLSDADGAKHGGSPDKQCLLEARPEGMPPVVVTGLATSVEQACSDAARKMQSLLSSKFGRIEDRDASETIRQGELD